MTRKSMRGMGADLYSPPSDQPTSTPAHQPTGNDAAQGKATFYLSPQILDELDRAWMTERRQDRRVSKSALVERALRAFLAKAEAA